MRARMRSRWTMYRPRLETLEDRWLPSAVLPGFDSTPMFHSDDGGVGPISIGFSINYFGKSYNQLFIDNNGNVALDQNFFSFADATVPPLSSIPHPLIAPFLADVDTTNTNIVSYGSGLVNGQTAFGVNWPGVGYFDAHSDKLNNFQLVLVDRSDTGPDNFDLEFNYDQIQWEASDFSGGTGGLGGSSARAGYTDGTGPQGTSFELPGSGVNGAFLDSKTTTGLIYNSLDSTVAGRYVFSFRNGVVVPGNRPPTADAGGPYTIHEGDSLTLDASASSDPDGDQLTYFWDVNGDGNFNDASGVSPTLSWQQLQALGITDGPSMFNVSVRVDDGHGHVVTSTATTLDILDTPPALGISGNQSVDEGSPYTLNLTSSDPGPDPITSWTVNWGDGNIDTVAGDTTALTHTYADGLITETIAATATNQDGTFSATPLSVTVNNVPPTLSNVTVTSPINENDVATLTGNITDPGVLDNFTLVVDWGDGSAAQTYTFAAGATSFNVTHQYLDNPGPHPSSGGDFAIDLTLTDKDGGTATGSTAVTVNNVAPTLSNVAVTSPINENDLATLTGNITDAGTLDSFTLVVDWGDGSAAQTYTFAAGATSFNVTHQYLDNPGPHPSSGGDFAIGLTLTDNDGGTATASTAVTVNNVGPTLSNVAVTSPINENDLATLTGNIPDPGTLDSFTLIVDWGDGSAAQTVNYTTGTSSFVLPHQYLNNNPGNAPYTVNLTLSDDDGGTATGSTSLVVKNVAPVITSLTITAPPSGSAVALSATFTDAGTLDTHTAVIDWGDGSSSSGVITESNGSGTVAASHVYASDGTFTVTLTVTDADGDSASQSAMVHVQLAGTAVLVPDPCDPTKTALIVQGTPDDDIIVFVPQCDTGDVTVILNWQSLGTFHPTGRIIAFGQAGDDILFAAGIDQPVWLFGGDGNDLLVGGSGPNVLVGGAGNDFLLGGRGRDLLIGGGGADRLIGQGGDDILIAGTTSFDAQDAALCAIMREWTSDHDFATRVANLSGNTSSPLFSAARLNDSYFLIDSGPDQTVFNDTSKDKLTGSAGRDWFFAGAGDKITDLKSNELAFIFG